MIEEHRLECDVLVAGGGMSGVAAALAAARCGSRVILCQDRPVLGGNASSEVRMHVVGADVSGGRGEAVAVEAREGGIIEELRLETAVRNPQRSASMFDLVLYEACRAEPGLSLMLNTTVVGAETDRGLVVCVRAERQSTEDSFRIAAPVFIDCTGDGRLGAEAGATFCHGREARDVFGESLAPSRADTRTMGSSLLFTAREHEQPMPFRAPPWARKFTEADLRLRGHTATSYEYGYWWVEWGGALDTIGDNETIRDELLAIMLGVWDHIKNGGQHGAGNWALDWFGFLPGKRESRRFAGQYTLTEQDVLDSTPFGDAIAYGGWPIDIHPPGGIDAADQTPCTNTPAPFLYDIPLRACVSRELGNLMFAGRNISATHVAFASTRVMATCAAMGQGVGTAAAYAVAQGRRPGELGGDRAAMRAIQQRLLRDDAYLVGLCNDDSRDLARSAAVSTAGAGGDDSAANVISGQTRSVHGEGGAPPGRALPGTHRWISLPLQDGPAELRLEWPRPVPVAWVQLVFDTGMHRVLTLSHSDEYTEGQMCWGRPQPETVRDYRLRMQTADGSWREIADVTGNYRRVNRHRPAEPAGARALALEVSAANGTDRARVCEVRVYGDDHPWPDPE